MLRVLGALFIMAGTGGFGYLMARGLEDHAAVLRRLVAALQHLESDMTFACQPMAVALQRVAQALGHEVGAFLGEVGAAIGRQDGGPLAAAWSEILMKHRGELMLAPAEMEALAQLGAVLGGTDREDQGKHLNLARTTLTRFMAEAETQAAKGKRVWQYLGFSLGALFVVFLY